MKRKLIAISLLTAVLPLPATLAFASGGPQGQPHGYEILNQQELKEYHEKQKEEREQAKEARRDKAATKDADSEHAGEGMAQGGQHSH